MKPFWGRFQKVRLGSKDLWKSKEDSKRGGGGLSYLCHSEMIHLSRAEGWGIKFSTTSESTDSLIISPVFKSI